MEVEVTRAGWRRTTAAALLALATACSSGSNAGPSPSSPAVSATRTGLEATGTTPGAADTPTPTAATGSPTDSPLPTSTPQDILEARSRATTPADPVQHAVLGDYQAYWQAVLDALQARNPDLPALTTYAAGDQLAQWRMTVGRYRDNNLRLAGGPVILDPSVSDVTGDTASVTDCVDARALFAVQPDGSRTDTATDIAREKVSLKKGPAGLWQVTATEVTGTCQTASAGPSPSPST